jgi:hypothetical protein
MAWPSLIAALEMVYPNLCFKKIKGHACTFVFIVFFFSVIEVREFCPRTVCNSKILSFVRSPLPEPSDELNSLKLEYAFANQHTE